MTREYQNSGGSLVCTEKSEFGWAVVSEHASSEQDGYWPAGHAEDEVRQVWRELRLAKGGDGGEAPGASDGTGQSVVKVSVKGDALPVQVPYCMALGYTKSMCALAMTGQHLLGALPLDEVPKQRALVIGLGAGSMPVWLEHTFPEGRMTVDALEIDPAVIEAATKSMGFPPAAVRQAADARDAASDALGGAGGQAMRVYTIPGEAYVEALADQGSGDYKYDMVFIDAFDKAGRVPPVLVERDGTFLKALSGMLAPKATVVLNLLVGMTGSGSSGGPKEIEAMVGAIHAACCGEGDEVFGCRTPMAESSGNQLYSFLRGGRASSKELPLKEALVASAGAVNKGFPADSLGAPIRFDFARRVSFAYQDWKPKPPEVEKEKEKESGGGGIFGFGF